jgi:hypothetical protein
MTVKKQFILVVFLVGFLASYSLYASAYAGASSNNTSINSRLYNVTTADVIPTNDSVKINVLTGNESQVTILNNRSQGTVPHMPLTKYEPKFDILNITASEGNISNPVLATSGNNVYIVYSNDEEGTRNVFVTQSRNFGVNYDSPTNLNMNMTGNSTNYKIGAAGDNVYLIFENDAIGNGDIFYAVSFDAGESWNVYNLSNSPTRSYNSTLTVDENGEAYISWVDDKEGGGTILYAYCSRWCW